MFSSSPKSVLIIQYTTTIFALIGLYFFDFTLQNYLTILLGYFLYSGIGVSMTLHRYYTHNSFEFKHPIIQWIATWFALMAGRGGIIGWVFIHRMHHLFSDTEKDPHPPKFNLKSIFFPSYKNFDRPANPKIIKDLLHKKYITITKYYNLLIIIWVLFLLAIDIKLLYFGWIVPVALTHLILNSFIYFGHVVGYKTHQGKDKSKNIWLYGILLWGEGWHNNHHNDPKNWNLQNNWWELDLIAPIIKMIKK